MTSNYYDTNIFVSAFDDTKASQEACLLLITASDLPLDWSVAISELTRAEADFLELFERLEEDFASNGIDFLTVSSKEIESSAKKHRQLKRKLNSFTLSKADQKHIMAAAALPVEFLVTDDIDFFDPLNKRAKKRPKKPKHTRVSALVKKELKITVCFADSHPGLTA